MAVNVEGGFQDPCCPPARHRGFTYHRGCRGYGQASLCQLYGLLDLLSHVPSATHESKNELQLYELQLQYLRGAKEDYKDIYNSFKVLPPLERIWLDIFAGDGVAEKPQRVVARFVVSGCNTPVVFVNCI